MKKKPAFRSAFVNPRVLFGLAFCLVGLVLALLGFGLYPSQSALAQAPVEQESQMESDQPPDLTPYVRPAIPEDYAPGGRPALPELEAPPGFRIERRDVVVDNIEPALNRTDRFNDSEPSIAIDPNNPKQIVISAFSGVWGQSTADPKVAPIWYSIDGGTTWKKHYTVPVPPNLPPAVTTTCPCDQTFDYDRSHHLYGTILAGRVYSGATADPTRFASWKWLVIPPPPARGVAQPTNVRSTGNVDQPWLLVNRDTPPLNVDRDNIYVAYADLQPIPIPHPARVAVALVTPHPPNDTNPPMFVRDVGSGKSVNENLVSPGHRLAVDPKTAAIYSLWQVKTASGVAAHTISYHLNRSTDGGETWTLNKIAGGIEVATADSTQGYCPQAACQPGPACVNNTFKFGTVNALLGGVLHAAVDPTNGDVYYVFGKRVGGKNRLAIKRLPSDGAGGLDNTGAEVFVTGAVEAALPSVAVSSDRTVGVLYTQYDGPSPMSGIPMFSAHFAWSTDQGRTFTDAPLLDFLSSAVNTGGARNDGCRQRVLGDYQQMKAVGTTFYGVFTANGVPFGRPFANHDPIFFKASAQPTPPKLDHFKAYKTDGSPPPTATPGNNEVQLRDQFDASLVTKRVGRPVLFANPVQKTRNNNDVTSVTNPDTHLKMYSITPKETRATPTPVQVSNQFGNNQKLKVLNPVLLGVPTTKTGVGVPHDVDHFKFYDVTGDPLTVTVELLDQFRQERGVQVREPVYFAIPTEKTHNGTPTPILHPADHLVCYKIVRPTPTPGASPTPTFPAIATFNQFGSETIPIREAYLLCVPSEKLPPTPAPIPSPSPTPIPAPTFTPGATPTATPSATTTATPASTPTATAASPTAAPTPTATPVATPSATPTVAPSPSPTCAPALSESFDDITTLPAAGWVQTNHSATIGTTGWFQGNDAVFAAQGGALPTSYIGANFNNTTGTNTISNWLLTPPVTLQNGLTMTFWTRTATANPFPDRLQVRMSTNGASQNVGVTATDVGDFSALLLDINPAYTVGGYPEVWTQQTVTVTGVPSATLGRLAFRYFVENGGPTGSNSNYIGIDTFQFNGACGGSTPIPSPGINEVSTAAFADRLPPSRSPFDETGRRARGRNKELASQAD